jgi:hypothetical protein
MLRAVVPQGFDAGVFGTTMPVELLVELGHKAARFCVARARKAEFAPSPAQAASGEREHPTVQRMA